KEKVYKIPEEAPVGTFVANITAEDPDGKDFIHSLRYSMGVSEAIPKFSINPRMVVVAGRLNRDASPIRTHPNISLTIRVEDNPSRGTIDEINDCKDEDVESPHNLFNFTGLSGVGSNKFTQDPHSGMIKPVNEFKPVFNSSLYTFNVSEIEPRSFIGAVLATDKDLPPTGISYSIVSGESGMGVTDLFVMDPQLGILRNTKRLDYETDRVYTLEVQASDNDGEIGRSSVIINVLEVNDEPPICTPNGQLLEVPVDLSLGIINSFSITCVDRDSSPKSFRYTITSGNVNNHFDFSPKAGSNITKLVLINPFDYVSGVDKVWEYRLLVSITDDNLLPSSERTSVHVQNGIVKLTIRPGVTIVTSKENVYAPSAWYVPFFILLGSLLLLGLLGYLTEMTNLNTVFDGEAIDPVYEYNSKSGARRWKDPNVLSKTEVKESTAKITTPPKSGVNRTEAITSGGEGNLKEKLRSPQSGEKDLPKAEATTASGGEGNLKQKLRSPKSGEKDLPKTEAESGGNQGDLKQAKLPKNDQTGDLFQTEDETGRANHPEPTTLDKRTESFLKLQKATR
ncbi:hypothetical protein E2320_005853, partial [Naja naja]